MPAAEELGLRLNERIAAYRSRNLAAMTQKTEAKLEGQKPNPSGGANPLLVREAIEDASWTIFLDGISIAALA
jgi:hypothetical protein